MTDLKYAAYCGLYCKHCTTLARIPQQAQTLYNTLKREGYEYLGAYENPQFNDFWKYLEHLTKLKNECPLCRGGCGNPGCKIRICAREKDKEICVYCDDYPCELFKNLTRKYPALLGDGKKLKELGIDAWLEEQEKRCERGYSFFEGRYDIEFG